MIEVTTKRQCGCAQLLMLRRCYRPDLARTKVTRRPDHPGDRSPATRPVAGPKPGGDRAGTHAHPLGQRRRGPAARSLPPHQPPPGQGPREPGGRRATTTPGPGGPNDSIAPHHSPRPTLGNTRAGRRVCRSITTSAARPGIAGGPAPARRRQHILRRADGARSCPDRPRYSHLGTSGTGRRDSASGNEGKMTC